MWKRKRMQGQVAASLYNDLTDAEQAELDAHLAKDSGLRQQAADLRRMLEHLPADAVRLDVDLAARVRARLDEPGHAAPPSAWWLRPLVPAMAAAFLAVTGLWWFTTDSSAPVGPAGPVEVAVTAPAHPAIGDARERAAAGDAQGAHRVLTAALEAGDLTPEAGAALYAELADVYYTRFRDYGRAHAAYESLRKTYPEEYRNVLGDSELHLRVAVLDEAAVHQYEPLTLLAAAERTGDFERYERVIARYPGSYAAVAASRGMARAMLAEDGTPTAADRLQAAIDRTSDPIVRDSLRLELAHVRRGAQDYDGARTLYEQASGSSNTLLAQMAAESLAGMRPGR